MAQLVDIVTPAQQDGTTSVVKTWLVAVGDLVCEDDPIVELETDKVALEIPSPASGIVAEIILSADDEAPPGVLLGRIDISGSADAQKGVEPTKAEEANPSPMNRSPDSYVETRHSPSVRRVLAEAGASGATITGTGRYGRVTKADALAFVSANVNTVPTNETSDTLKTESSTARGMKYPHSAMRRSIAKHMSHSVTAAPHVTAVFEADFSAIIAHRAAHTENFKQAGVLLTYTSYFIAAAAQAMKAAPMVNSQWHDDAVEVLSDINIGVGTALGDDGLIVPVVHRAQTMSLQSIATSLQELTQKARAKKLQSEDLRNGTFTISNHGVSGSIVATPIIINQPQSAILGIGKLEKRVCVITHNGVDGIQIRPKAYVTLTIDHRVIDGHQTNAWLTRFVEIIESWPNDEDEY